MTDKTYEEGLRDGAINAIEKSLGKQENRLDSHSRRLAQMEKMIWLLVGGLAVLQALPLITQVLKSLT